MKSVLLAFLLVLVTLACASSSTPSTSTDQVSSWQTVDTAPLNRKINKARQTGQTWVSQPELFVFKLFALQDIRSFTYQLSYDQTEQPQHIEIQLIRDGFLDDSQRGDIQHIKLSKTHDQSWRITELKKAFSCWRSETLEYTTRACP